VLNTSLYSWTYRVAEWAWEAEVAEAIAAAEGSLGGASLLERSMPEDGSPSHGLVESLAQALAANPFNADEASAEAEDGPAATSPKVAGLASAKAEMTSAPAPVATSVSAAIVPVPVVEWPSAPAGEAPVVEDVAGETTEASTDPHLAARGRWVLRGYHTQYAYALVPDPMKQDNWDEAVEQRDGESHNKVLARLAAAQGRRIAGREDSE
jgi:hypothetical protein